MLKCKGGGGTLKCDESSKMGQNEIEIERGNSHKRKTLGYHE